MFRNENGRFKVLLGHPGDPYFQKKDDGVWTISKGEVAEGEDLLTRARIEFEEELGIIPQGLLCGRKRSEKPCARDGLNHGPATG